MIHNILEEPPKLYFEVLRKQFKTAEPHNNDICKLCEKRFGLHFGGRCP